MITIDQAIERLLCDMPRLGYSAASLVTAKQHCERFRRRFQAKQLGDTAELVASEDPKAPVTYRRLLALMHGESPRWKPRSGNKTLLSAYYSSIVRQMDDSGMWSSGSVRRQAVSAARSFFRWLSDRRLQSLDSVTLDTVRTYYLAKASGMRNVKNLRFSLKAACGFLKGTGLIRLDCSPVFALRPPAYGRLLPALRPDEVARVLEAINRQTAAGKRDYALVLLGVTTGMRASDIVHLKLRDIDWRNGTIALVQGKTSRFLSLPLLKGVGEAVQDYVLNARPSSGSDRLFLTTHAPYTEIAGNSMSSMFARLCARAGVPRAPHDGKSFHSLRRAAGTNLTAGGVPLPTVSQVLGHRSLRSAESYLCVDARSLRKCALGFAGIEPKGLKWN